MSMFSPGPALPDGPEGTPVPDRPAVTTRSARSTHRGDQAIGLVIPLAGAVGAKVAARVVAGSITGNVLVRYWVGFAGPRDFSSARTIALSTGGEANLAEPDLAAVTHLDVSWAGSGAAGTIVEIQTAIDTRLA
jgi:hypothetical protein